MLVTHGYRVGQNYCAQGNGNYIRIKTTKGHLFEGYKFHEETKKLTNNFHETIVRRMLFPIFTHHSFCIFYTCQQYIATL